MAAHTAMKTETRDLSGTTADTVTLSGQGTSLRCHEPRQHDRAVFHSERSRSPCLRRMRPIWSVSPCHESRRRLGPPVPVSDHRENGDGYSVELF